VADCIEGTQQIMRSGVETPLNLGSDELVDRDQLVDVIKVAGVRLARHYNRAAPQGVRDRCSDNTLICKKLGWGPQRRSGSGLRGPIAGLPTSWRAIGASGTVFGS
jgi:nucleoside-diphosphate-sugar epimerase